MRIDFGAPLSSHGARKGQTGAKIEHKTAEVDYCCNCGYITGI